MKKPGIPPVPRAPDKARMDFDRATKERLEIICGERGEKIAAISADASMGDVIAKINEIVAALQ